MSNSFEHMKKPRELNKQRDLNEASGVFLTPPEIAKLLRVSPEKVLGWIRRAELKAVNVGNGVRPRYRIHRESFGAFLIAREVQPPTPQVRRRRLPANRKPIEGGPIDPVLGKELLKKKQAIFVMGKYYRVVDGIIQFV